MTGRSLVADRAAAQGVATLGQARHHLVERRAGLDQPVDRRVYRRPGAFRHNSGNPLAGQGLRLIAADHACGGPGDFLVAGAGIPADDCLGRTVEQCLLALKACFKISGAGFCGAKFALEIDGSEYQERCQHEAKHRDDRRPVESRSSARGAVGRLHGGR